MAKMKKYRCGKCEKRKPVAAFYRRGDTVYTAECRDCSNDRKRTKRAGNPEHHRRVNRTYNDARFNDVTLYMNSLLRGAKSRRGVSIAAQDLMSLYKKQGGRCAVTGRILTHRHEERYPTNISIDRIDSDLPYESGNVRLTCFDANIGRGMYSDEHFLEMCFATVKHYAEQRGFEAIIRERVA